MKKLQFIISGIALCIPLLLSAQDRNGDQELSASYGLQSGTDILQGFSISNSRPNYDHPTYNSATSKSGNFFLTYRYFISQKLDLGVTLGTEFVSFDYYSNPIAHTPVLIGNYKANVTTLAVELKPVYYNGSLVQLYGLIGLGGRYYSEKEVSSQSPGLGQNKYVSPILFNTQWTPIGARVGKTLSGFVELGIGYKGLINGGVCYKFKRKAVKEHTKEE